MEVYVADRESPEKRKSADDFIKSAIKQYIEGLLERGKTHKASKEHFQALFRGEPDIFPAEFLKWIFEELEDLQLSSKLRRTISLGSGSPRPAQSHKSPKLFCKDTLYHSGLCCRAVTTCTSTNLSQFLSTNGHTLVECSLTSKETGLDQFLISTQGNNTLYVAFRSVVDIQHWLLTYKSFATGKHVQNANTFILQLR